MVVVTGEFGRTPRISYVASSGGGVASGAEGTVQPGRDHWPQGFSCVLGGGGLRSGAVIGATNPDRDVAEKDKKPTDRTGPVDPIEIPDLYATIMDRMGVRYEEELITPIGRPLALCEGTPIARLLT